MPIDDEPAIMMTGFEIVTMKQTLSSCSFSRTITDDTQPGGPVERTIEYPPSTAATENRTTKPHGNSSPSIGSLMCISDGQKVEHNL